MRRKARLFKRMGVKSFFVNLTRNCSKDKPGKFRKEDRDIPFSGLPKTNNELSITRLLDPYNSTYVLSYPRFTREDRKKYTSKDYKSDAIPSDKPKVENLAIYGPDKDRVMKVAKERESNFLRVNAG